MKPVRTGFTLIELLVVIAIIALLTSVLLPTLSAAKASARATVCAASLKQIAYGWVLYAQEHRDVSIAGRPATLPGNNVYFIGNGWKYRPRWLASLGAAAEIYAFDQPSRENVHQQIDNQLLVCTEAREWKSERNSSYGYNYQFLGNARLRPGAQTFVRFPVKTDHLLAAETVLCADSLGTAAAYASAERTFNRADGADDPTAVGNHAYMLDPPRLASDSDRCDDGRRSAPDDRHRGEASFAFADGHVRLMTPEAAGYLRDAIGHYIDEPQREGEPFPENRLFSGSGQDDDPPATE